MSDNTANYGFVTSQDTVDESCCTIPRNIKHSCCRILWMSHVAQYYEIPMNHVAGYCGWVMLDNIAQYK